MSESVQPGEGFLWVGTKEACGNIHLHQIRDLPQTFSNNVNVYGPTINTGICEVCGFGPIYKPHTTIIRWGQP